MNSGRQNLTKSCSESNHNHCKQGLNPPRHDTSHYLTRSVMSMASTLKVGQTVKANTGKETHQGILRYIGAIKDGPPGTYCGIELPDATGKNDGSVKGQ